MKSLITFLSLALLAGCDSETSETFIDLEQEPAFVAEEPPGSGEPNGLADHEVTDFLTIVRDLPGGEFPEFEPGGVPPVMADDAPEAAILVWRSAYRRSCDPSSLARSWSGDPDVQRVLSLRGYSPEQFADLVRRISLAVTAESLENRMDFAAARNEVEQQLNAMCEAIHQLDFAPDPALTEQERNNRRQAMMLALQDTTALGEFLSLLSEIPSNARAVAGRRRSDLAKFLPDGASAVSQFERYFESSAEVVPAANWQPQN
jgi:hypothetical protein